MAEYIEREAAITALNKVRDDQRVFKYATASDFLSARDAIERATKVLESLPAADVEPVQEWISVDDRLPEPKHEFDARNWYLVALSNGVVKELAYEFHNHSVFGYGWRETVYPVTHWMPLPPFPKGGNMQ